MPVGSPTPAVDATHPGGMRANRVFPTQHRSHLDPFVLFERFHIEPDQGFDTHPHRGFEIVSYMLEGEMAHADSMGHESVAGPGDAMRITTGGGMRHSELPAGDEPCSGLQLWVNLPREEKDADPGYEDARAADLPTTETEGATVTTVVGEGSPIDLRTSVEYLDVRIDEAWAWDVPDGWNGFCYVVDGEGSVADGADDTDDGAAHGESIGAGEFLVAEDDGAVTFRSEDRLRLVALAGSPHGQPIEQRGPFVL